MNASITAACFNVEKSNHKPIRGKRDALDKTNYRPILVATFFSKILERTLHR